MRGQSVLPPLQLQFLPPPISFGHARAHIDLNVDFKAEVEPFLGRCLVRFWLREQPAGEAVCGGSSDTYMPPASSEGTGDIFLQSALVSLTCIKGGASLEIALGVCAEHKPSQQWNCACKKRITRCRCRWHPVLPSGSGTSAVNWRPADVLGGRRMSAC